MPYGNSDDESLEGQPARKLFNAGDLVTMAVSCIMVAFAWGSQSRDIEDLNKEVETLRQSDMTAGARSAIAEMRVTDRALEARITNIEQEMRTQRSELMLYLSRIESKIDSDAGNRRSGGGS